MSEQRWGSSQGSAIGPGSALVVAVGDYDDPRLPALAPQVATAERFAGLLSDSDRCGFSVTVLPTGATADELGYAIADYLRQRDSAETVLLYLACHGLIDSQGHLYFAARDTNPDAPAETGLAAGLLAGWLDDCPAHQQVLLLDCPTWPTARNGQPAGRPGLPPLDVFDHGEANREVVAGTPDFIDALRDGLWTGNADQHPRDGQITVAEAVAWATATSLGAPARRLQRYYRSDIVLGRTVSSPTAPVARARPKRRLVTGAGALVIVAALILLGRYLFGGGSGLFGGGPGGTDVTQSPSATATKLKPTPAPTLPPVPAKSSGTLSDGDTSLGVTAVAFSGDGSVLVTGDGSGAVDLWDPTTHRQLIPSVDDGTYCQQVEQISADDSHSCDDSTTKGVNDLATYGDVVATVDQNGFIYRWSTEGGAAGQPVAPLMQDQPTNGGALAVAYDPTGHYMATGDGVGNAYLWTGQKYVPLPDQSSPVQPVTALAFSRDGTALAAGDNAGTTDVWTSLGSASGNSSPAQTLPAPQGGQVTSLAFGGSDGKLLAVGDSAGDVCVYQWQTQDATSNCFFSDPNGANVTAVAFSKDGTVLAIGASNGDVYLYSFATYDFTDPTPPKSLLKHPFVNPDGQGDDTYLPNLEGVSSLAFDPASPVGMLAVGDANGQTYLWRMNWLP